MDLSKVVIKLQSSMEQKGPATQRKGKFASLPMFTTI